MKLSTDKRDLCLLLLLLKVIMVWGAVFMFDISKDIASNLDLPVDYFFKRHIIFLSMGLIAMYVVMFLPNLFLKRMCFIMFVVVLGLLILLPFLGDNIKGAKRWIYIFGISLQPSELLKPVLIVVNAMILSSYERLPSLKIIFSLYLGIVILLMMQPDFGMVVMISAILSVQLLLAGMPIKWLFSFFFLGIIMLFIGSLILPHIEDRIDAFLCGDSYQIMQSIKAYKKAGFLGNEMIFNTHKIPDSHTDFVFPKLVERGGALSAVLIIFIYFLIVFLLIKLVYKKTDLEQRYIIAGGAIYFALQIILNISVTLNLLPAEGMVLPFLSYGGSALLSFSILFGICFNFLRKNV